MKHFYFHTHAVLLCVFFFITFSLHSQVVMVRYKDYDISPTAKVTGYTFTCRDTEQIIFIDTTSVNLINDYFSMLQYDCDTCNVRYPDVRRQIIIIYPNESYKALSYDKFSMELNGKVVIFNKQLHDLIEGVITRQKSSEP